MKLLYDTVSQRLIYQWPSADPDNIVGLDPRYEIYSVVQDPEPSTIPLKHHLEATEAINHEARTVTRGWNVVEDIPMPAPEATPLQVRAFLISQGISLDSIPTLIASVIEAGAAREEALMRWEYALSFPKDYTLVVAVANALNLDLDQVWGQILAIE